MDMPVTKSNWKPINRKEKVIIIAEVGVIVITITVMFKVDCISLKLDFYKHLSNLIIERFYSTKYDDIWFVSEIFLIGTVFTIAGNIEVNNVCSDFTA